jgi:hypothetical protein
MRSFKSVWLTPWKRISLEGLLYSQVIMKFPAFYGTMMFIAALKESIFGVVVLRS